MKNIQPYHKVRKHPLITLTSLFMLLFATYISAQNPSIKVFKDWEGSSATQHMFQKSIVRSRTFGGSTYSYIAGATVNGNGDYDIFVEKFNPSGTMAWSQTYAGAGAGNDVAADLQIDAVGNVYVCGSYYKNSTDSNNAIVIKYNSAGTQKWTYVFNGTGSRNDGFTALAVNSNTIFVVGSTWNGSTPKYDYLLQRLDSSGSSVWQNSWNYATANLWDGATNLYSSGGFLYVAGGVQSAATTYKYGLLKVVTTTGVVSTSTITGGTAFGIDQISDVQCDATGNLYVTGSAFNVTTLYDIRTIKLDTTLTILWSHSYDGGSNLNDFGSGIYIDANKNVFVTGGSSTTSNGMDYTTIKYNSAGTQKWVKNFNGAANGGDSATCIVVRDTNKVYVSGYSYNGTTKDYYTIKYDDAGNKVWEIGYNCIQNADDIACSIASDTTGQIFVSGQSKIPGAFVYNTVKYIEKSTTLPQDTITSISNSFVYIENHGQLINTSGSAVPQVRYYTMHSTPAVYFTDTAVSYVFDKMDISSAHHDTLTRVDMKFVGANSGLRIRSMEARDEYSNFFYPHIPDGRCKVENHDQLVSFNVWNYVDMIYGNNAIGMKYYFICKPGGGGNPATAIDLKFEGADSVHIGTSGELLIYTKKGIITNTKATAWQLDASGNFSGLAWQPSYLKVGTKEVQFTSFGTYNTAYPLIIAIDWGPPPHTLHLNTPEWSMYFGGTGYDEGTGVCVDTDGNPYFTGFTSSPDFPIVTGVGAYTSASLLFDAYLSKFGSANGATVVVVPNADKLLWTTYWGGASDDKAFGVTTVGNGTTGNVYITGYTESSNFPTFNNAGLYNQTALKGTRDAFIIGLDNNHGGLLSTNRWASYFGGNGSETGNAVTKDGVNNIFIAGSTSTTSYSSTSCSAPTDNGFPKCNNYSAYNNGGSYGGGTSDGFIAEFANTGQLNWSTYYGGANEDAIDDIATINDVLYVTGKTAGGTGFPITSLGGAYNQGTYGGGTFDSFLGKFKTGAFVWGTYYGGNSYDEGLSLVTDPLTNNVFMGGETSSSTAACTGCVCTVPASGEFPMCHPAGSYFQGTGNAGAYGGGTSDGFFAKFNGSGVMTWGTYYGGNGTERVNDLDIDYLDQLYFTGQTTSSSPTANFVQSGPQLWYWGQGSLNGTSDAIIGYFDASQARTWSDYYSDYITTTSDELGNGIAVYATGSNNHFWYMTGATNTITDTQNGIGFYCMAFNDPAYGECCLNAYTQFQLAGSYDAFVTRFSLNFMLMEVQDMGGTGNALDALVYPNPADENINVQMNLLKGTDVTISIYSVTGQLLYEKKYGKQIDQFTTQIDFSNFASGVYVLQVATDDCLVSKKVIKNR